MSIKNPKAKKADVKLIIMEKRKPNPLFSLINEKKKAFNIFLMNIAIFTNNSTTGNIKRKAIIFI